MFSQIYLTLFIQDYYYKHDESVTSLVLDQGNHCFACAR